MFRRLSKGASELPGRDPEISALIDAVARDWTGLFAALKTHAGRVPSCHGELRAVPHPSSKLSQSTALVPAERPAFPCTLCGLPAGRSDPDPQHAACGRLHRHAAAAATVAL